MATSRIERKIKFEAPVWSAVLHPDNHHVFTASLYEDEAKYVDWSDANNPIVIGLSSTISEGENVNGSDDNERKIKPSRQLTLVTAFSKKGDHIIAGTSKGALNIIDCKGFEIVHSAKITSSNIKQIRLGSSGWSMVLNSSDRVVRLVSIPDLTRSPPSDWEFETVHKFQDVVNRLQWNSVAISSSGEYILATTYESAHDIYMWETSMGSLVKIYEGPKEELVEIEFHPTKPLIAATGLDSGTIYLWTANIPQKWSALAPDFVELQENIYYEEKEDEFDLPNEETENRELSEEEDSEVDLITVERNRGPDSSFVIPVSYEAVEEAPPSDSD
jgi:COMPASS component SWD1